MRHEDNKAMGIGYQVEEDKLCMMTSINFSKRKKKMRGGKDLLKQEVRTETPKPLTRRGLLSHVAGLYDPVGLVTPAKQKGTILVKKVFQEGGGGKLTTKPGINLSQKASEKKPFSFLSMCSLDRIDSKGFSHQLTEKVNHGGSHSQTEVTKPTELWCIWGGRQVKELKSDLLNQKPSLHHWIKGRSSQSWDLWSCLCSQDQEICWKAWKNGDREMVPSSWQSNSSGGHSKRKLWLLDLLRK